MLNISGSDICKIGCANYVFERINQIRRIVKSAFSFYQEYYSYNIYISSTLKNTMKFSLESELHSIFKYNNLDEKLFKFDF
ncbi:GIY-YIG nuclease family protein [Paraclostridium bifermentans]|uniref:GIY-YIG nuclease family protein n=1 Tax=Paraclostridium bifermentans TaxID=1490 RepID=UPI001D02F104